jgi:hypothetical protein
MMKQCLSGLLWCLLAACGSSELSGYAPPDLGKEKSALSISDQPLAAGGSYSGRFPGEGRYLGFIFQGAAGASYNIVLTRISGADVPAEVIYAFEGQTFGEPLAWTSADARELSINGWKAPRDGTYLILVDVAAGPHTGTFRLELACAENCGDPLACATDADCPAGMVCYAGLCFDGNVECNTDADCLPDEVCLRGFCVQSCQPMVEVCDGWDNDCDGVIDEDCASEPCATDADCARGEACIDGLCQPLCECQMNADCPAGQICQACQCVPGDCPDADGDGYYSCRGDCDDINPAVNPAAPEICGDYLDNDCDGIVDDGCGGLPCASDADCPAGEMCWDGMCVPGRCGTDSECGAGLACCAGLCADLLFDPRNCGACGMSCAAGERCLQGACAGGDPCGGITCAPGFVCESGVCVPECNCRTDSDCAQGQVCLDCQCRPACDCRADSECDDGDPDTTDLCRDCRCEHSGCVDRDGDGFCADVDCDDGNSAVNPAALETCADSLDNDCDGLVDEDCGTPCRLDSDCPAGMRCMNGVCVR